MPQVAREVVKERARRLREKGEAACARHLAGEVGARRRVLVETAQLGRTEGFTPVRFAAAVGAGEIREVTIAGHDGRELLGRLTRHEAAPRISCMRSGNRRLDADRRASSG